MQLAKTLVAALLTINLSAESFASPYEIVVSDWSNDRLAKIDPATLVYQPFTASGAGGLDNPTGISLGADGSLLVANGWTNDVRRFNATTGQYLGLFAQNAQLPILTKTGPNGNLYVASRDANGVLVYDRNSGALVKCYVVPNNTFMWWAFDVDFLPDGDLLVSSFERGSILRFDANTAQLEGVFSSASLQYAAGMAWGPDHNLYVARYGTNRIDKIDGVTGQLLGTFAAGNGMLRPVDLAFTPDGRLFVVNERTPTISIFDSTTGSALGQISVDGAAFTGHSAIFILPEPASLLVFVSALAIGRRRHNSK